MKCEEYWLKQELPRKLTGAADVDGVLYEVRHALRQTEQDALAEIQDGVLRQQAGVLFQVIRSGLSLLEVPFAQKVWVAQSQKERKKALPWPVWVSLCALAAGLVWLLLGKQWIPFGLCATGLVFGGIGFLLKSKKPSLPPEQEVSVTLKPDVEKLCAQITQQMRMADRCLQDFKLLNEQLNSGTARETQTLARAADLAEAVCELEEDARQPLQESVQGLLEELGLQLMEYTPENSAYFNLLPSLRENHTMTPAILDTRDGRLVRRGTAAVVMK